MKLYVFIVLLLLTSCKKPNPHPELIDPIYADLQKSLGEYKKLADDEKKKIDDFEKELKAVKPQTGQIRYAQKRLFESQRQYEKLQQMVQYYEVRVESRLKHARSEYLKAWNDNKEWPQKSEYSEYESIKNSQPTNLNWNQNERIKKYKEAVAAEEASKAPKKH